MNEKAPEGARDFNIKGVEWDCPNCFLKHVVYGKTGCVDPNECSEEKNNNFLHRQSRQTVESSSAGIGISAISNEDI